MSEIRSIALGERVDAARGINFLRVEWWDDLSRFVVIKYSREGKENSLRMDINKRVFLDHLDDPEIDEAVQSRALPIWEIVAEDRRARAQFS